MFLLPKIREILRPKLKKTIKKNHPRQLTLDPQQKPTLEKYLCS